MNFLDTHDIAGSNAASENHPQQSLNEEVSEVLGQLGRFWGGFRKQSQTVLETARRDLSEVVIHAQKELTKLTSEPAPTTERANSAGDGNLDPEPAETTETAELSQTTTPSTLEPSSSSHTLFSRLQSALPPNILETARNHLPDTLKHASENVDITQFRSTLLNEFQRVQGVTRAQAEEYAHKSEALFRDAVKEAGDVLRDAVKILPPEGQASGTSSLIWDGTDMWSLPLESSDATASRRPFSAESTSQREYADARNAVVTRAEALLRRLKQDPIIIRHDPSADSELGVSYSTWITSEFDTGGGIEGDKWSKKIAALLNEAGSGDALKNTRDILVPSELTETEFWTRFFFRLHQIEVEEEKRKTLIEGTLEEEDFSWEDDEEEATATSASISNIPPVTDNHRTSSNTSLQTYSSITTGRECSDEGYDVVSSGNRSPDPKADPDTILDKSKGDSDDPDSDWE